MSGPNFDASEIGSFFDDPDASNAMVLAAQHVVAPVIQGATLTMDETMSGGGIRVVFFIFDASPSMSPVAQLLREGFNVDFVPAVQAAREDDISALRVGGAAFSSGSPTPLWRDVDDDTNADIYFHPFNKLPQLTSSDYDPDAGYSTALHRAIVEGSARAFAYAADLQQKTGIDIDVDIIVLSDGANNEPPRDASEVHRLVTGRDKTRVRYVFFYFETDWGLSTDKPAGGGPSELERYVISELGFDGEQVQAFALKPGETAEERASRFRRLLMVMSKVSASRGTSAVVATASVMEDDELV